MALIFQVSDGHKEYQVPSLFLRVDTAGSELAKLQRCVCPVLSGALTARLLLSSRSKERLLAAAEAIVAQACKVLVRVADAVLSNVRVLSRVSTFAAIVSSATRTSPSILFP